MTFPIKKLLLSFLFLLPLHATAEDLHYFLNLDRFDFYKSQLEEVVAKRGHIELAKALDALSPRVIFELGITTEQMEDAGKYDDLLIQILRKRNPTLKFQESDLRWEYNFLKNKLNDAFLFEAKLPQQHGNHAGHAMKVAPQPPVEASTLDADLYISDRTTRAVYWDATHNNIPLEFHMGAERDFLESVKIRNARIIGEIEPKARNYNKIYAIQLPGDSGYRYAFNSIGGNDRLNHLKSQIDLATWHRSPTDHPPIEIHGSPQEYLARTEALMTQQLKALPRADRTIIGQAGAIGGMFDTAAKQDAALTAWLKDPNAVKAALEPKQVKAIEKLAAAKDIFDPDESRSFWTEIEEALAPVFEKHKIQVSERFKTFSIDNETHKITDYVLEDASGKQKRWRVISNMWGDEIVPVAKALKNSGTKEVTYIGTAGAFPKAGLEVGDVQVPDEFVTRDGKVIKIKPSDHLPKGAKIGGRVANVGSPFDETQSWFNKHAGIAQSVELETGYLAETFSGKGDRLNAYLLISDVINSEENLASAESGSRRNSLNKILEQMLHEDKAVRPVNASEISRMAQLVPNRDPVSRYQADQVAKKLGYSKPEDLQKVLTAEKSFTAAFLDKTLEKADHGLNELLKRFGSEGIYPRVSLHTSFLDGTWNPKSEPIQVTLHTADQSQTSKIDYVLKNFSSSHPDLKNVLQFHSSIGPVPASVAAVTPQKNAAHNGQLLFDLYHEAALFNGGLVVQYTPRGGLKHVEIPLRNPPKGAVAYNPNSNTAFFAPDSSTAKLMQKLMKEGSAAETVLAQTIDKLNESSVGTLSAYQYRLSKVDSLPDGSLARIVPQVSPEKGLIIDLQITPKGLKTPPVVLEELVHLSEISNLPQVSPFPTPYYLNEQFRRFQSPMEWAETTWNAEAGSKVAQLKLARYELDAAREAADLVTKHDALAVLYGQGAQPSTIEQTAYLAQRKLHAEQRATLAMKEVKIDLKAREAEWTGMKTQLDALEKEALKLDDLVLANDRKGVRRLLQAYLPWPLMEPSEKQAWTSWLDSLERPDPKRLTLTFRGLADDVLLKSPDGKVGVVSTVLSKNQGSYTRRLRSLTTMRTKIGNAFPGWDASFRLQSDEIGSLSRIVGNHAMDPMGSPFLSVSTHDVAQRFGANGRSIGAFLIDERRLLPSFASLASEAETLVPLIIFPDEIVELQKGPKQVFSPVVTADDLAEQQKRNQEFVAKVEAKLGSKLPPDILTNSAEYEARLRITGIKRFEELARVSPTKSGKLGKKPCKLTPLMSLLDALATPAP